MTKETNIKKIIGMGLKDETARIEEANRKYFEAKNYTNIISAEIMKDSDKRINRDYRAPIEFYIDKNLRDDSLSLSSYCTSSFSTNDYPFMEIIEQLHRFNITSLDLSNNDLGEDAIQVVRELKKCKTITSLDLSNNQLGKYTIEVVKELQELEFLTTLDLSLNDLGDGIDANSFSKLFLQLNNLERCPAKLAKELVKLESLSHLILNHNKFNGSDCCLLMTELVKSQNLVFIDFSKNSLRKIGKDLNIIYQKAKGCDIKINV